jgi:alanyl-tRNA synthetase
MFLDFFISKGHKEIHSSSLVPANDPTLLFTNAGMNQFKDVFLGLEKRDYQRATTSQKCVRAGGKHNDLENVGFTNRHHTFFEMLGNFSFGDYFKKDAVAYAWELVTSPQWYAIDGSKLYATIFKGEGGVPRDDEAYGHWLSVGVPAERIFEMGMKDNFWAMGDTGPCGPCSELHYDMGVESSDKKNPECAAGECKFPCECGRYVEIWNLVFMQFDRDANGVLNPLPKPSIDTGAGLERVTAVLQEEISNYDTDLFKPLIKRAAELTGVLPTEGKRFGKSMLPEMPYSEKDAEADANSLRHNASSLRVIADHARAATFLISDGVVPANEGRGYVLRKIMRRAIRHGRLLGQNNPFLHEMVYAVRDEMQEAYPELKESAERVARVVRVEEHRFAHTLDIGLQRLEEDLAALYNDLLPVIRETFVEANSELLVRVTRLGTNRVNQFQYAGELYKFSAGGIGTKVPRHIWKYQIANSKPEGLLELAAEDMFRDLVWDIVRNVPASEISQKYQPYFDDKPIAGLIQELQTRVSSSRVVYSGEKAFKLYDTFGLPLDFIQDTCRDLGIEFDQAGFDLAMDEQRERARASWKGGAGKQTASPVYRELRPTEFTGYERLYADANVLAITKNGSSVPELNPGEEGEIILDVTPFYADSGGQVGDVGILKSRYSDIILADVTGCYQPIQGIRAHQVRAKEHIVVGEQVRAVVDEGTRRATMRHHTGTHLLHAALRNVLGTHVKQAGSLVDQSHLRFDFSHFAGVEDEELQDIEDLANREVLRNDRVEVIPDVPIDVAVNEYKAMALFGEKYGDKVRVIRVGDFSTELCGGTHTSATGEIGLIKILKESSVSAGVRRLEAVAGEASLRHFRVDHQLEGVVSGLVGRSDASPAEALRLEMERKEDEIKRLRKELEQARMKSASSSVATIGERVREIKGVKVLAHRADNLERPQLRTLMDNLRNKIGSGVVVLGSVSDGKVAIIVGVTKDLTSRVQAGKVVGKVAQKVGGSGGGRPDMAEAGGKDPQALDSALNASYEVVEELLQP